MKESNEEKNKGLLILLLLVVIIGPSIWLLKSLYSFSRPTTSDDTPKQVEKKRQEEPIKEKKVETEEDKLNKLVDKMMLPFIVYNRYIISDESNNYYFKEDKYTFDTISNEEKIILAITIYQEEHDYPESQTIPTYQIRKIIKDYFGREMPANFPESINMQYNFETYKLEDGNYKLVDNYGGISEIVDRIQQKIVNKEIINNELVVTVNYVFIKYSSISSYTNPDAITSNIYTDLKMNNTLMIDVK